MPAQRTERNAHPQRDARGHLILPFSINPGTDRPHQLNHSRTIYTSRSATPNASQAFIPPSVRQTVQRTPVKLDAYGKPFVPILLPQPTGQRVQFPAYGSQSASPPVNAAPYIRSNAMNQIVHGFPTNPNSPTPSSTVHPNTHNVNHTRNMPSSQGQRTHIAKSNNPHSTYPPNAMLTTSTVGSAAYSASPAPSVRQVAVHANTGTEPPRQHNHSPIFNANPYPSSNPLNRAQPIRTSNYGSSTVSPAVSRGQGVGNMNNGAAMPIPRQAKAPIPNPYYSHAYPTPSATPIPDNGAVTLPRPRQPNANPYLPNIVPSTPVVGAANHSSAHAANKLPSSVNGTSSHAGTFPAPKPGVPVNPIVHNPNRPNQHPAIRPQRVHHTNQFPAIHRQYPQRVHLVNIAGKMTRIVPKNTNIKALLAPLPNRTTIDPRLLLFRAHGVQKQDPSPSVQEALAALYGDAPPRDRVSEENLEYFLTRLDGKDAFGNVWTGSRLAAMMLAA